MRQTEEGKTSQQTEWPRLIGARFQRHTECSRWFRIILADTDEHDSISSRFYLLRVFLISLFYPLLIPLFTCVSYLPEPVYMRYRDTLVPILLFPHRFFFLVIRNLGLRATDRDHSLHTPLFCAHDVGRLTDITIWLLASTLFFLRAAPFHFFFTKYVSSSYKKLPSNRGSSTFPHYWMISFIT
jgi:hypothetical protein